MVVRYDYEGTGRFKYYLYEEIKNLKHFNEMLKKSNAEFYGKWYPTPFTNPMACRAHGGFKYSRMVRRIEISLTPIEPCELRDKKGREIIGVLLAQRVPKGHPVCK